MLLQYVEVSKKANPNKDLRSSRSILMTSLSSLSNISMRLYSAKYFTVFGAICINLVVGGYLAVGNLIPYLASYLTATSLAGPLTTCTPALQSSYTSNIAMCNWMMPCLTLGMASFGFIGGLVQLRYSTRATVLVGGSVVVSQLMLTSYHANDIYLLLLCSFGVLYGIGIGICFIPVITCTMRWFPANKALVSGTLLASSACGSIAYSLIETLYLNPHNLDNDERCGYALQASIMNRVPSLFSVLALACGVLAVCGLCVSDRRARGHKRTMKRWSVSINLSGCKDTVAIKGDAQGGHVQGYGGCDENDGFVMNNKRGIESVANMRRDDDDDDDDDESSGCSMVDMKGIAGTVEGGALSVRSLRDAVLSRSFWMVYANTLCAMYVLSWVYSDWKLFAQQYLLIEDDAFLLQLSIAASVSNCLGRLWWGFLYDRVKSYRFVMIWLTALLFCFMMTLPGGAFVGSALVKVFAFVWVCVLWFGVSGVYTVLPAALSDTFGEKYCSVLTGLIVTAEMGACIMQSSSFVMLEGMRVDHKWATVCVVNALFVGFGFVVTVRFQGFVAVKKIVQRATV